MTDGFGGRLEISVAQQHGASVITVNGDVDLDTVERLGAALRSAAESADALVLDLLGVPFMDSSGLKALLVGSAELGERLSLVMSPGAPVARLLDLAEVRERFVIYETVAAATGDSTGDAP
jgi:anti-anti-sigma factor